MAFSSAQGKIGIGINAGLPVGDAGDLSSFAIIADLGYYVEASDQFEIAPTIGIIQAFGKEIEGVGISFEVPDIQFLPIALQGRINASEDFWLQAGLGYALGINEGNDGGFYYSPQMGYNISEAVALSLGYRGVSNNGTFSLISAGLLFSL
ncbi:hypothetical protein [Flagellimonas meishanensis]|uniref:hypothetical protein n=1 Tax=Flagellimonas meishanensis TaxID=2873264 RepID=UPI001CA743BE|nr:hypothetical protein [[Muricauda] meishanensis]